MQQPHEAFFSFSVPPKPIQNHHLNTNNNNNPALPLSPILTNLDHHLPINQIPFNPSSIDHHPLSTSSLSDHARPHTAGPFAFNLPPSSSTSSDSTILRSPNDSIPTPSLDRPFSSIAFATLHPINPSQNYHQRSLHHHPTKPSSPHLSNSDSIIPVPNQLNPPISNNYPNHARPMTAPDAGWPGSTINDSYHYHPSSAPFAHHSGTDPIHKLPQPDAPSSSRVPHSPSHPSPRIGLHSLSAIVEREPCALDAHSPTQAGLSAEPSSEGTAGSPDSSEPSPYTPAQPDQLRPNTHAGTSASFAADTRPLTGQPRPNTGHPNLLALSNQHAYGPPPMLVHPYRQPIFSGHSHHHHHQFFGPTSGHYGMPPSIGGLPHQERLYNFNILPGAPRKRARRRFDEVERLYECNYPGCTKAYGTLNHLNAHITMQKHGPKRLPQEFKEIRKEWRARKKAEAEARTGTMHSHQPMGGYAMVTPNGMAEHGRPMTGGTSSGSSPANSVVLRPAVGPFSAPPSAQAFAISGQGAGRDWYGEHHGNGIGNVNGNVNGNGTGQTRFVGASQVDSGLSRDEYVGVERFHNNGLGDRNPSQTRSVGGVHGQYYHEPHHDQLENHHHDGFIDHHHHHHHHQQHHHHRAGQVDGDEQGDGIGSSGVHSHHHHHFERHHHH